MYSFESRIRYSETDIEGRLTLEGLLNYFQDCSTFHSEEVGQGPSYMIERKMAWVLAAWQIAVNRYPEMGERVTVGTLPYKFRHFMGFRNFFMLDAEGNYLAKANSLWTLIDLETGKPVEPLPEMLEAYRTEERIPMEYADRRIAVPQGGSSQEPVKVGKHMLDTNHHVNNEQYVAVAKSLLPEGLTVRQVRVEYKKQAFLGDVFLPRLTRSGNLYTVSLEDREGGAYAVVEFDAV